MDKDIWMSCGRNRFDPNKYLYHYTSFETALKILYSNQFRLSPLSATNDTTEQKMRIGYAFSTSERKDDIQKFEAYWMNWTTNSKLLCFSTDGNKASSDINKTIDIFDVGGRGFALPRMWAQYAKNNTGVCLVVNKEKLINRIIQAFPEAICKEVSYFGWTDRCEINKDVFEKIITVINHNPNTGYATRYLAENEVFTDYAYFSKLQDWETEKEYRIFVPSDVEDALYIEGVNEVLQGIVVGEKMDKSQMWAINKVKPENIPIRKIVFGLRKCSLDGIDDAIE